MRHRSVLGLVVLVLGSVVLGGCNTMDVAAVKSMKTVALVGISAQSQIDDRQVRQNDGLVASIIKQSASAAAMDENVFESKRYLPMIKQCIFEFDLPFKLVEEDKVLACSTYKNIDDKMDGMFAPDIVMPKGYKLIMSDNIMGNSSEVAAGVVNAVGSDGAMVISLTPVVQAHDRSFLDHASVLVKNVDIKSVRLMAQVQFTLYSKDGAMVSRAMMTGKSDSTLKSVNGIYNAADVEKLMKEGIRNAFKEYHEFLKEKGAL